MRILKWQPDNLQSESVRYYLADFESIPDNGIAWVVPDQNGEALLDGPTTPTVWLQDILFELQSEGLISEDELLYPYIDVFDRLAELTAQ
ncbi:hypothetical protein [Methylobacter luteus]|jgi:hypothetical protein|uniref:hypothetical protein n=1 Tax=Methylobacter luteus TaxID=415 RepID=UPI0004216B9B|nr:hypothetical protein [Methylobacter luteus]